MEALHRRAALRAEGDMRAARFFPLFAFMRMQPERGRARRAEGGAGRILHEPERFERRAIEALRHLDVLHPQSDVVVHGVRRKAQFSVRGS